MYFGLIQMNFPLIVNIILVDSLIIWFVPERSKGDLISCKTTFSYVNALNWVDLLCFLMKKIKNSNIYVKMVKRQNT